MKIVVLDGYTENPGDLSWKPIEELGETRVYDRTDVSREELIHERIGDAQIVLTNKVPLTKETMDACSAIRFIGVLATGYNVVDVDAAKARGIVVCNVPAYGTASVAQFAISLLLEICGHVGSHGDAVREGRWQSSPDWCFWDHPLIELDGKTMGIIGFGRIGQRTGRIAAALGMRVLAHDSHPSAEGAKIAEYVDLDALLRESDVIALHCPLFPETQGMICKETIDRMKDGVILLNNARGPLIVESDLADALRSGKVYAAAVDVVSTEPIRADNPLLAAPNCIITPHISWAPLESRRRIMECTAANIRAFLDGAPVNVVNP